MDDIYLFGPIEQVLPAAIAFAERLKVRTGIELNLGKSALHSTDPARDHACIAADPCYAATFRVGQLEGVGPTAPYGSGFGVVVSGVPVGD